MAIRGINQEPTLNQPTTTADPSNDGLAEPFEWVVVEKEVYAAGVNQAGAAVDAARACGAAPTDVRAILAYGLAHRDGWSHWAQVLFHRLQRFQLGQPCDDGWPPFTEEYQAKHDREQRERQRAAEHQQLKARRQEMAALRTNAAVAWQGFSLVSLAHEIDPELARGIEQSRKRLASREQRIAKAGTELTASVSADNGPS